MATPGRGSGDDRRAPPPTRAAVGLDPDRTREHSVAAGQDPLPVSQQSTVLHPIPDDEQTRLNPVDAAADDDATQVQDLKAPAAPPAQERTPPPPADAKTREELLPPDFGQGALGRARSRPAQGPPGKPAEGEADRTGKRGAASRLASRHLARLRTLTGMFVVPRDLPRWVAALAGAALAFALLGGVYLAMSRRELPEPSQLRQAYPYGYEGAVGPQGKKAPGAAAVEFRFAEVRPCSPGSYEECLLYEYAWGGRAAGTMLLRKTPQGWVRASDEGMPFRLAR